MQLSIYIQAYIIRSYLPEAFPSKPIPETILTTNTALAISITRRQARTSRMWEFGNPAISRTGITGTVQELQELQDFQELRDFYRMS